jgi:two-component system, NarL family, response regulator NreC
VCPPAQTQPRTSARTGKIRCVLAHDHVLIRQGLRRLLEDEPDLEVVSEVGNVAEAVHVTAEEHPEIVIADINTLGLPPDEAEELLLRASPLSRVVFLSAHEDSGIRSLRAGGSPCAVDGTSAQELVKMVRNAYRQLRPEEWETCEALPLPPRRRGLTAREQEVLKLLAEGSTVRSAAHTLGLSVKTVDAHKFNLMRKLGVHNKAELVMWAIRKQVVKIPANF